MLPEEELHCVRLLLQSPMGKLLTSLRLYVDLTLDQLSLARLPDQILFNESIYKGDFYMNVTKM